MDKITDFAENSPYAIVLMSFLSGILFSGISWGLIYVILFLILWEILYFGYISANGRLWDMDYRITVFMAAVLGYLAGAFFHYNDDHHESWSKFCNDCDYWGREMGWFES